MKQSTKIYFMALVISLLITILKILLRNNRYTLDSADVMLIDYYIKVQNLIKN